MRLRIDQTTLSRYLNPRHPSIAPPRVIDALHSQLGVDEEQLKRALALRQEALETQRRQRGDDDPPATDAAEGGTAPPRAAASRRLPGTKALVTVTAVVLAFVAGLVVARLSVAGDVSDGKAVGSSSARPEPSWFLVRKMSGDQLWRARTVRYLLRERGYDVPVDSHFDARTEAAVQEFQRRHGLGDDGKVGPLTWPFLVVEVSAGDKGDAVKALQWLLGNVGQGGTEVSGHFGGPTREDLRHFQKTHGLPATGVADATTWRHLMAAQRPPVNTVPLSTGHER